MPCHPDGEDGHCPCYSRWATWTLHPSPLFIQDTAATSPSVMYQPTTNEWCQTRDNQVSYLTTLPSPFLTTKAGPCCQWQCGKQQPSFNCPQPFPNNNNNVALPHHTTPNHAANNNKDEQPTIMTTHDCPLTKTNQHQPKPTTSIHTNSDDHYPWTETDYNEPRWGKLTSSPPPIFLTWNQGAKLPLAMSQPNLECH